MEETVQRERGEVGAEPRGTTCLMSGFEKCQQPKEAEETQVKSRWKLGKVWVTGPGAEGSALRGGLAGSVELR